VTRGVFRILLTADHCSNVEGSAPTTMRSCIDTVLRDDLLQVPGARDGGAP
jgi:hypothetical protein